MKRLMLVLNEKIDSVSRGNNDWLAGEAWSIDSLSEDCNNVESVTIIYSDPWCTDVICFEVVSRML